jgi:hypothetical protein
MVNGPLWPHPVNPNKLTKKNAVMAFFIFQFVIIGSMPPIIAPQAGKAIGQ